MRMLLLGGAGYVGRVLADRLQRDGHQITIHDLFLFAKPADIPGCCCRVGDTRQLTTDDFADIDVVLDLAAISNDPSCALNPDITREVNGYARVSAATNAKKAGVKRYVLFSSCSVYGANDDIVDETSEPNPLTEYAASNVLAERGVLGLADAGFTVSAFRLATVFGLAPSMRFDLVVNTMVRSIFETGRLQVTGGGQQYRPLIHVADIADAACTLIDAPTEAVNGEIFNIAHVNMQMNEVAAAVIRGVDRRTELVVDSSTIDHRNYRVATDKVRTRLGIVAERTIEAAAAEILAALEARTLVPTVEAIRLNGYRQLLARLAS